MSWKPVINPKGTVATDDDVEVMISANSIVMEDESTVQEQLAWCLSQIKQQKQQIASLKRIIGTSLSVPVQVEPHPVYNGRVQKPVLAGYEEGFYQISGTVSEINAGTYNLYLTLLDPSYSWYDGTNGMKTISWTIDRQLLEVFPEQEEPYPVFDGKVQAPSWKNFDDSKIEAKGGTLSASEAGTHYVNFMPSSNYAWPNGNTGIAQIPWKILPKRGLLSMPNLKTDNLVYNGTTQYPVYDYDSSMLKMAGDIKGVEAGTYTATFEPKNSTWRDNDTQDVKTSDWHISPFIIKKNQQLEAQPWYGMDSYRPQSSKIMTLSL